MSASPEACEWSGIPAQGNNLLTRLPRIPPSGFFALRRTGFRSLYGCGAAGALHPSSSLPSDEDVCSISNTPTTGCQCVYSAKTQDIVISTKNNYIIYAIKHRIANVFRRQLLTLRHGSAALPVTSRIAGADSRSQCQRRCRLHHGRICR